MYSQVSLVIKLPQGTGTVIRVFTQRILVISYCSV